MKEHNEIKNVRNHKATGKKVTSIMKRGTLGMVYTGKGILGGGAL